MVNCASQKGVDELWENLTAGGGLEVQCGWLKDKPRAFLEMLDDPDPGKSKRFMQAMFWMKKLDIAQLEAAYRGR